MSAETDSRTIVSKSPMMLDVLAMAELASESRSAPVLLVGESGTGKGLLAEHIHARSSRSKGPLVAVNCGALSPTLIETELFGHEKGAFTGAIAQKKGLFEQADQGTLLLDEVAELPLELQVKLLRVVETRMVRRVGSAGEVPLDVRIISATNRDLESAICTGEFREDLYYRLNVIKILIPPLRERVDDIAPVASHLLTTFANEAQKNIRGISSEAMDMLLRHGWPGNVRELSNVMERAVVVEHEDEISPRSVIFDRPIEKLRADDDDGLRWEGVSTLPLSNDPKFDDLGLVTKRALIEKALKQARGNKSLAADLLGLSRFQFHRRLRSVGSRK